MRRGALWVMCGLLLGSMAYARHTHRHEPDASPPGMPFSVAGLTFLVPPDWVRESADNPARAGQWSIPAPAGAPGAAAPDPAAGPLHVVVFYFGPAGAGSTQDNLDDWTRSVTPSEAHPGAPDLTERRVSGLKVAQVVAYGSYRDPSPIPGEPPAWRANWGLLGVVIEGPQGPVFWRFTGPETELTAALPAFLKVVNGLKLQAK